jgi:ATP-dependent Lon protease
MSKGKLSLPNIKGETELEDSFINLLKNIIPKADVSVDDELWQAADNNLQAIITNLRNQIKTIKAQIGSDTQNVSEAIKNLKEEIIALQTRRPTDLIVKTNDSIKKDLGISHKNLPSLLKILSHHLNVSLVGPSGSGKTHAARQCAEALRVDFYFTGAIANEYKLTGYMDAKGEYVTTEFRKAYENGGLFLFDEIDASFPQAVLAFNAALANDFMDFPDNQVKKHKDFYCIAAANTIGQGADRQYVGRNQLDAASLDRFVFLDWPYLNDSVVTL